MGGDYISGRCSQSLFLFHFSTLEGFSHLYRSWVHHSNVILTLLNSSSSSSGDYEMIHDMFVDMDKSKQYAFVIAIVATNSFDMFNVNKLEEIIIGFMCKNWNVFITLWEMSRLFKTLTNVILADFDELMLLVAPTIAPPLHAMHIL